MNLSRASVGDDETIVALGDNQRGRAHGPDGINGVTLPMRRKKCLDRYFGRGDSFQPTGRANDVG